MLTSGKVEIRRLREQLSNGQLTCEYTLTYERPTTAGPTP